MAGHVQDRWYKTETDADGKEIRVRSDRYGTGLRYRARYIGPDGTEKSKSYADGKKRLAEKWLTRIEADMDAGQFIDPKAGQITFGEYAEKYLGGLTTDLGSREVVCRRIRLHAVPYLRTRPMGSFKPEHMRTWLNQLQLAVPNGTYRRAIYDSVSSLFNAAVDDRVIRSNPCHAQSVKSPIPEDRLIVPWPEERVVAVREGMPPRYAATVDAGGGCGLRQGEVFGLAEDNVDFDTDWVHVRQQIKRVGGVLVFAPPKRGKLRDAPLSPVVGAGLREHMELFPPVDVKLPWKTPDGPLVTRKLIFTSGVGKAIWRSYFDDHVWKPALAHAGVIPPRKPGQRYAAAPDDGMHALRHFYASMVLEGGGSIKALSTYLGHSDPGFTLKIYTHLLPSSEEKARAAVSAVFQRIRPAPELPVAA
ncbi:Putative prophage phiRv2 integrase [Streptomyces sp. YIM 121038]|uniref:tyrosine-type recombinase/integrase n=1 Tax=Streptomyces sp. YIM 121038 TaxID=2136401 RepID=UPI0011107EAD|nr:site-specific integrase [Streptomyces sp. YIM 121038]QCX76687.1 Putative prophage phiRv2 integrase [Streptomyces sp. YIM 121038]